MIFYRHERFINLLKVAIGNSMKSVMSIVKTLSAIKTRKNRIIGAFGCIKSDTFLKMARNKIHVIEIAEYNGQDEEDIRTHTHPHQGTVGNTTCKSPLRKKYIVFEVRASQSASQ